ncbi:uncharacterized protein LOC112503358 [Cynara cardunculus var. scolymus]|uniref:uncharacterized protein LOC112503358 n=1 Tax=Cynara cardunculus var. scolymus TaxID=59895 RepID=UPI000D62EA54|nr:uncharacterized protein LOC112503358 [Cynara cardunculus var. scolymus]
MWGNGLSTHAWEDKWSEFGPLIQLLSYRFINGHGFHNNSSVSDVMQRFGTNWPVDWIQQYPQLQSILIPSPSQMEDTVRWLDAKLSRGNFEVKVAWKTVREVRPIVHWYKLEVIKKEVGLTNCSNNWEDILNRGLAQRWKSWSTVQKLGISATVYHIWRERNRKFFDNFNHSGDKVVAEIKM